MTKPKCKEAETEAKDLKQWKRTAKSLVKKVQTWTSVVQVNKGAPVPPVSRTITMLSQTTFLFLQSQEISTSFIIPSEFLQLAPTTT
jgi:hypothetical protein